VAFVYQNPRAALVAEVASGRVPDSTLLGQNHLAELGIDAFVHDLLLTRRGLPRRLARVAWNLREVVGPWELGGSDVAVTPLATFFPVVARARRRPRVVVVNYGLCTTFARSTRLRRRLLSSSLQAAATVVCLGDSQSALTAEQTRADVQTVPLGTDERFWSPREAPSATEGYVLAVGKDLARDYRTLAYALRAMDARAELVAHPRNLEGVRLPPGTRTHLDGRAELRDLYAGAACVVIPQRAEGYAYGSEGGGLTALLEAWAMARPVVVTDRAIMRDYVTERTGVIVPAEDPAALAEAIARVLADGELARRLGAAGREQVECEHTTRLFAQRLAPILRAAAA
jgi:glycosyltransferase involved in cell wall biosynthesis